MYWPRTIIWVMMLSVCFPYVSRGQNIIVNGDFETWPITAAWPTIGTGITVSQEMAILQGGLNSAQVDINTTTQALTDFRQTINATAGVIYDVSVWIYHSDNQARARLYCNGFTGVYSDENIAGSWQQLTFTYTAGATGPIEIGLRFYDVAGNWAAAPSIMYVDNFEMTPQTSVTANQFEFLYTPPANAGLGLPFDITICATDGSNTDAGYATPITLTDNGSTATFTSTPTSPAAPVTGCITFTITPQAIGTINLDFGNVDFTNIQTGNIPVTVLAIPTISASVEVPDTDPNGTTNADALNDTWENNMGAPCLISYQTVYGTLFYDNATHVGAINGLVQVTAGPGSAAYPGTAEFRLVNMDGPRKGTHFINGDGTLSANMTSLQANAPKPTAVANDLHFTENTGNLNARNAFLFTFAPAVSDFGLWVGDVETNPQGTNAEVILFNGDAELTRLDIPTSSTLAEQLNTGGTGCGSSSAFPGCGNHTTLWISFTGGDVTDMLIIVGDDDVGGSGLTEHLSFAGPTTGGDCDQVVLNADNIRLTGEAIPHGNKLSWTIPEEIEVENVSLQRSENGNGFEVHSTFSLHTSTEFSFLDPEPLHNTTYYRIHVTDRYGRSIFSNRIAIKSLEGIEPDPRIYPNPCKSYITINMYSLHTQAAKWELFDLSGKTVQREDLELTSGNNEHRIALTSLAPGIYWYRIGTTCGQYRGTLSKY